VEFLEDHTQYVNTLHNQFNGDLARLRQNLSSVLLNTSEYTIFHTGTVVEELRKQEASTQYIFAQTNNNTCIQNLRNIMDNTISLSGFRVGGCSGQAFNSMSVLFSGIYDQIMRIQLPVSRWPIHFMAKMQGENVFNDENYIMATITSTFLNEKSSLEVDIRNLQNEVLIQWERDLNDLNHVLDLCFRELVGDFQLAAGLAEERISTICGQ
jgi:hypothetical protein